MPVCSPVLAVMCRWDVRAAAEAAAVLSRVAAAHPEIAEIEVNPLLVQPAGATGLDARIVLCYGALELESC